ncbi:hypothetical protein D3C87_1520680 [compost metagenome]
MGACQDQVRGGRHGAVVAEDPVGLVGPRHGVVGHAHGNTAGLAQLLRFRQEGFAARERRLGRGADLHLFLQLGRLGKIAHGQ